MCSHLKSVVTQASLDHGNIRAPRLVHSAHKVKSNGWICENCKHTKRVVQHDDEEQDLGKGVEENGEEGQDELEVENSVECSSLREESDRTLLEESDDAKNACQSRNTCCQDEEVLLPGFLEQRVYVSLELFQMILMKESPDAELDDQLGDALDERLKGGDVPHVVGSLLHPV